jgi:hypothetical protein
VSKNGKINKKKQNLKTNLSIFHRSLPSLPKRGAGVSWLIQRRGELTKSEYVEKRKS